MDDGAPSLGVGFEIDASGSFDALERLDGAIDRATANALAEFAKVEKASAGMISVGTATREITTFGAAVTREAQSATRELSRIEKAGERMVAQLSRQAATFGKSASEIRSMKAEAAALAAEEKGLTALAAEIRALEADLWAAEFAEKRRAEQTALAAAEDRAAARAAAEAEAELQRLTAATLRQEQAARERAAAEAAAIAQLVERSRIEIALERNTGLGRMSATDGGATYSALAARAAEEEARATAAAAAETQRHAAAHAQLAAAVRGSFAAQQADAEAAERLRMSTDPLYAATKRLNDEIAESTRLYQVGATAPAEYARQQEVLTGRLQKLGAVHDQASAAARRGASTMMQFGMQVNDVATMAALGAPPFQIFASQIGQVVQVAQMAEGGVGGFIGQLGALVVAYAPVIAIAGAAVAGFALFQRSIASGVDTDAMVKGLGLTSDEIKKLKNVSVSTGDVVTATFQVLASNLGISMSSVKAFFSDAMDFLTRVGKGTLAALYAEFMGTFRAIAAIVAAVKDGRFADIIADVGKAYRDAFNEANKALDSFGAQVTKQVRSNKLADLKKQANEIIADRAKIKKGLTEEEKAWLAVEKAIAKTVSSMAELARSYDLLRNKAAESLSALYGALGIDPDAELTRIRELLDRGQELRVEKTSEGIAIENRMREQQFETLAGMFESAFSGSSGRFWDDFKDEGRAIIADLAAQFVVAMLAGNKFDLSTAFSGAMGRSPLGSLLGGLNLFGSKSPGTATVLGPNGTVLGSFPAPAAPGTGLSSFLTGKLGLSPQLVSNLGKAFGGAAIGSMASGLAGMLGIKQSGAGAAIGGAIGSFIPIPGGSIIGGLIGGTLGGLLGGGTKIGYSRLTSTADGIIGSSGGNSASRRAAAGQLGGGVGDALTQLAQQLGGNIVGGLSLGSVGQRNKKFYFDPTPGTKADRQDYASAEEAAAAAIRYAIQKGVIAGLSATEDRILRSTPDVDAAIDKIGRMRAVFDELKQRTDPLGASLEALDKGMASLRADFTSAGASAQEMADLEKLYQLQRADIIKEGNRAALQLENERKDLLIRLYEAQGKSAEALALQREMELAATDETLRELLKQVHAAEDAAAAAQEAAAAANLLRQAWASVGTSIMDEVARIRGLDTAGAGQGFAMLMARFNAATSAARGGDIEAAKLLPEISRELLDAAAMAATSRQELTRVQQQTAASLEATYGLIGALTGQSSTNSTASILAAVASTQAATAAPTAANDDIAAEIRALRDEVAQLRSDNNAGHAATAGNTGAIKRTLDSVTAESGGDAISIAAAA